MSHDAGAVFTFEDEHGHRWAIGTHNRLLALTAFQREDHTHQLAPEQRISAADMAAFEYGWWLRIEPAHPDCEREYIPAHPDDAHAEPGVRWRP